MKVVNSQAIMSDIVEFAGEPYDYIRYSRGNWEIMMGNSTECIYNENKLAELDAAWDAWEKECFENDRYA